MDAGFGLITLPLESATFFTESEFGLKEGPRLAMGTMAPPVQEICQTVVVTAVTVAVPVPQRVPYAALLIE